MRHLADDNGAGLAGDLGVALQTKVVVAFGEKFWVE